MIPTEESQEAVEDQATAVGAPTVRTNGGVSEDKVRQTIEAIRPALQADGGDIVLKGVDGDTGVVTVELVGACNTCPISGMTMKAGIERIMRDRVEGVTEVVAV